MAFEPNEQVESLLNLADKTFDEISQKLPADEPGLKLMLLQTIQSIDFLLLNPNGPENVETESGWIRVLLCGWNLLLSRLITEYTHGGIYLREFTPAVFRLATTMAHIHGRVCVLRSAAEALRFGTCSLSIVDNTWCVSRIGEIIDPFLMDTNEIVKSDRLKDFVDSSHSVFGWTVVDTMNHAKIETVGSFQQRRADFIGKPLYRDDLEERIAVLVHPFDTGHGIITAYDASPETDYHFIAVATEISIKWRDEAGLHPDVLIGGFKVSEIVAVVLLIISLHLKHIRFCTVAASIFPEISLPQSLTIWTTRPELIESIAELSQGHLNFENINGILDLIIFTQKDANNLKEHSRTFIPLLISMGGDMLLRPTSSIKTNPFETIKAMLHWRVPDARNLLAAPREGWLRDDIYAMFYGTRYICVPSNVKLRSAGRILTDVDGAVFDRTTGELALFQLKCQDYSLANKKELRSRAKNLSDEMDFWGEAVISWIKKSSALDVITSFQIPLEYNFPNRIYLFGVSRHIARTDGYGAIAKHGAIALCNYAQFCIARTEIGPSLTVLGALHERLFKEMETKQDFEPVATEFSLCDGIKIELPDFFYDLVRNNTELNL